MPTHPQNSSVLITVQPLDGGFAPGVVRAGCVLPSSLAAGAPVFPQLEDICHGYDSIVPPALGGLAPVHTTGKTKMCQEQQYGPCPQFGIASLAAAQRVSRCPKGCLLGWCPWDGRLLWSQ